MTLQRALLLTHRWLGLGAAALLVVIALTGAVLAYEPQAERLVYRSLYRVVPGGQPLGLDSVVGIATRARAGRQPVEANAILLPDAADDAIRVQFGYRHVFVDPYRGTVLGERGIGESVIHKVRVVHHSLLAGPVGRFFMLLATFAGLLLTVGGLVLWWPRRIVRVTRTATWRGLNFDLHNILGISGALGIVLFAGTAVLMELGGALDPLYRRFLGDAPNVRLLPASPRSASPLRLDSLVRLGTPAVTGVLREITLPERPGGTVTLLKQTPGEYGKRARNIVWIDGNDGRIRGAVDQTTRPLGSRVAMRMEDWHTGAFAAPWSRVLALVSCLVLAFQSISGPLIWWRPRTKPSARRMAR